MAEDYDPETGARIDRSHETTRSDEDKPKGYELSFSFGFNRKETEPRDPLEANNANGEQAEPIVREFHKEWKFSWPGKGLEQALGYVDPMAGVKRWVRRIGRVLLAIPPVGLLCVGLISGAELKSVVYMTLFGFMFSMMLAKSLPRI